MTRIDLSALLDAMQARCDAATAGSWRAALFDGVAYEDGSSSHRAGVYPGRESGPPPVFVTNGVDRRDAAFITAARTDLPRLVAALRAVLSIEYTDGDDHWDAGFDFALDEVRHAITTALEAS